MDENTKKQIDELVGKKDNLTNEEYVKEVERLAKETTKPEKEKAQEFAQKLSEEKVKKKEEKRTDIALHEDGSLALKTVGEKHRIAQVYVKSGMLPRHFNTAEKVLTGFAFLRALGLKESIAALSNVAVVNGKAIAFGDLPLTLAMRSGKIMKFREFLFDNDYEEICYENKNLNSEVYGACCQVETKTTKRETFFTLDDAKKAKLLPAKEDAAWFKYPKIMLKYRARTECLKDTVPEALNGVDVLEYSHNMTVDTIDVTPNNKNEAVDQAKELFGD